MFRLLLSFEAHELPRNGFHAILGDGVRSEKLMAIEIKRWFDALS